jgi:hydrogenase/urease accessory protein HupE
MSKLRIVFAGLVLFLTQGLSTACAHEGHGHTTGQGNSVKHYLSEPIHLAELFAVGLVLSAGIWIAYRWMSSRKPSHKIAA